MSDISKYIKEYHSQEVDTVLENTIRELGEEGFSVEFGNIGRRTTYALIYTEDHETEIVGYTFIKDIKYYKENVGKLKALQQAIARKELAKDQK